MGQTRRIDSQENLHEDQATCDEFVKLMDYIRDTKRSKRRDLHIRDNFVPLKGDAYKSKDIISNKPQGGGIYPRATKSTTVLRIQGTPNRNNDYLSPARPCATNMSFLRND